MSRRALDPDEALAGPFYAVALMLVGIPLLDFAQTLSGFHPGNIQWRFATVGLLSGALLTPLLGVVIATVVAAICEHRVLQRILAIANLIAAGLLLVVLCGFILDVLQLRTVVPEQARAEFQAASIKAMIKHLSGVAVFAYLGLRSLRVSRWRSSRPVPSIPLSFASK